MSRPAPSLHVARSLMSFALVAATLSLTACQPRKTTVSTTTHTVEPAQTAPTPAESPAPIVSEVPKPAPEAPSKPLPPAPPPEPIAQSPAPQPNQPDSTDPDGVAVNPDSALPTPAGMRLGNIEYRASDNTADAVLEQAIVAIMTEGSGDQSMLGSMRYSYDRVDLNDDGTPETLVYLMGSYTCGSGGCTMLILEPARQSYELVSRVTLVNPPVVIAPDKTAGWKDLMVFVEGGGAEPRYARLQFDGNRYPSNPSVAPPVAPDVPLSGTAIMTEKMTSDSGIQLKL